MTTKRIPKILKYYIWTGLLLLCLALALTVAGVLRWPILIYGAAPCFFCAAVLLLKALQAMPPKYNNNELNKHLDALEMVF